MQVQFSRSNYHSSSVKAHKFKELQLSKKEAPKENKQKKIVEKTKTNVKNKIQPDQEKVGEDVMRENVKEAENPHDYITSLFEFYKLSRIHI